MSIFVSRLAKFLNYFWPVWHWQIFLENQCKIENQCKSGEFFSLAGVYLTNLGPYYSTWFDATRLWPECSSYLAQVCQPQGRHFYQKWHISNPGGTILTKNVLFPTQGAGFWSNMSYLQPRRHNFNQKCHIANTCALWYDFGKIHHKIHFKYLVWYLLLFKVFK